MIDDAFLQTKISITLGSEDGYLVVYLRKFSVEVGDDFFAGILGEEYI